MRLVAGQCRDFLVQVVQLLADERLRVPILLESFQELAVLAFARPDDRREDADSRILCHLPKNGVDHLVDRGLLDAVAAVTAVLLADLGIQQA